MNCTVKSCLNTPQGFTSASKGQEWELLQYLLRYWVESVPFRFEKTSFHAHKNRTLSCSFQNFQRVPSSFWYRSPPPERENVYTAWLSFYLTRITDQESLRSWYINGRDQSILIKDSLSDSLSDLGLLILIQIIP